MNLKIKEPTLVNAKDMNEQYIETFSVPTDEELDKLQKCDVVKVCVSKEIFKAEIIEVLEKNYFICRIDNQLVMTFVHGLRMNDFIKIRKDNIYSIEKI